MDMYLCERFDGSPINATVGFYHVNIPFEYLRGVMGMLLTFEKNSFYQAIQQVMRGLP